MEKNTWLLIANSSKARFYSLHKARLFQSAGHQDLTLNDQLEHSASRKKVAELISDKSGGFGRGTFVEETNPKQREAEIFAAELAQKLDAARCDNQYRDLIIAAPPFFLGLLKKNMSGDMIKKICLMIEKDYTAHTDKDLITALAEHI